MRRRSFISSVIAGAGTLLAGCSSLPANVGGNAVPSYHRNLTASDGSSSDGHIFLDVEALFDLGFYSDDTSTPTQTPTDPEPAATLVLAPLVGSLIATFFGFGFGLPQYGNLGERLNRQLDTESISSREEIDLASILIAPDGVVTEGTFDVDTYAGDLSASFTEVAARDDFTIFEENDEQPAAIAIASDALVFRLNSPKDSLTDREHIERILDARAGRTDRLADQEPVADWGLRAAGSHQFVISSRGDPAVEGSGNSDQRYNPVADSPLEDVSATLLVSGTSIRTSNGEAAGATFDTALAHTDTSISQSAIEDAYSESDATVSVSVSDGDQEGTHRAHIKGEFAEESLGL